jgi:hypothetical protein
MAEGGAESRLYCRDEELTQWEAAHDQFRTTIALAMDRVEEAIRCKVPFGVVVFDA